MSNPDHARNRELLICRLDRLLAALVTGSVLTGDHALFIAETVQKQTRGRMTFPRLRLARKEQR